MTLSDDDFANESATFVPSDSGQSKWVWVIVWFIFALVAPSALIGGALWMLGPVVRAGVPDRMSDLHQIGD